MAQPTKKEDIMSQIRREEREREGDAKVERETHRERCCLKEQLSLHMDYTLRISCAMQFHKY